MKVGILASLGLMASLSAQEGSQIYQTYCAACHGANGEGRPGAAPALSQSSWVNGDPNIMTKILLHGLQGRMSMHDESFELYMPAQTLLSDEQISQVATYVRSHWGNKAPAISPEFVKKTREETKNQSGVIGSMHFVRPYDLKDYTFEIENLLSSAFPFTTDFDSIADEVPESIEEEQGGLIAPSQAGSAEESFTAKWTGLLEIEKSGEYHFSYGTDNAARIAIDGNVILERSKGDLPSVGSIELSEGQYEIDIYYAHEAKEAIFHRLFLSGPEMNTFRMHSRGKKKPTPPIIINPEGERALVHRNFLEKGGERTLAVGFPQDVNFTFSTDQMRLSKVWKGEFLRVDTTWNGRASGKIALPVGKPVSVIPAGETFRVLFRPSAASTEVLQSAAQQFKGYHYGKEGVLHFDYQIDDFTFRDQFTSSSGSPSLTRQVTIEPQADDSRTLYWKLLENASAVDEATFRNKDGVELKVTSSSASPSLKGTDVVLPITQTTTLTLDYVWN